MDIKQVQMLHFGEFDFNSFHLLSNQTNRGITTIFADDDDERFFNRSFKRWVNIALI